MRMRNIPTLNAKPLLHAKQATQGATGGKQVKTPPDHVQTTTAIRKPIERPLPAHWAQQAHASTHTKATNCQGGKCWVLGPR